MSPPSKFPLTKKILLQSIVPCTSQVCYMSSILLCTPICRKWVSSLVDEVWDLESNFLQNSCFIAITFSHLDLPFSSLNTCGSHTSSKLAIRAKLIVWGFFLLSSYDHPSMISPISTSPTLLCHLIDLFFIEFVAMIWNTCTCAYIM